MKLFQQYLLIIGTCLLSVSAFAAAESAKTNSSANLPDITGNYECQGYDPYGKSNYSNPVNVTKNGDTYSFQWLSSKGYPFILGTGVFNKNVSNVVSVVFWDPKKSEYFGTEVFEIKSDGAMNAFWTLQAENLVGTETCSKKKS